MPACSGRGLPRHWHHRGYHGITRQARVCCKGGGKGAPRCRSRTCQAPEACGPWRSASNMCKSMSTAPHSPRAPGAAPSPLRPQGCQTPLGRCWMPPAARPTRLRGSLWSARQRLSPRGAQPTSGTMQMHVCKSWPGMPGPRPARGSTPGASLRVSWPESAVQSGRRIQCDGRMGAPQGNCTRRAHGMPERMSVRLCARPSMRKSAAAPTCMRPAGHRSLRVLRPSGAHDPVFLLRARHCASLRRVCGEGSSRTPCTTRTRTVAASRERCRQLCVD